jgi:hypothetical protein
MQLEASGTLCSPLDSVRHSDWTLARASDLELSIARARGSEGDWT